jgi:hypothetical protein
MTERGVTHGLNKRGLDKRKVCVFLILVAIGLLCLCVMVYTLFYARPRGTPIQGGAHSSLRLDTCISVHS